MPGLSAGVASVDIVPNLKGFGSRLNRDMGSQTSGIAKGAKLAGIAIAAGLVGVGAALTKGVMVAGDFENIMSQVGAVSGASAGQMKLLQKAALDLGASTKFSAREVAAAEVELTKAGLTTSQILGGALKGALALAAAGNLELADAASIAANAMNLFGLRGKDVRKVADALATAANATTADVADFGMALTQGGAAAKSAGFSFKQTIVVLEALAKSGVKNSDAGTSMKAAFIQLIKPTEKQARAAKDAGIEFQTASGKMKDAAGISEELRDAGEKLTRTERTKLFATLAGTDGFRTLLALYDAGPKKLKGYDTALGKSGTAAATAARMQDNLAGSWETFTGAIETLQIKIGLRLIPSVRKAIDRLSEFTGFLGDVADAKNLKVAVRVFTTGVGDLRKQIEKLLFGELKSRPIRLPSGKILDFQSVETKGLVDKIAEGLESADWSAIGKKIGGSIGNAITVSADKLNKILNNIAAWAKANVGKMAEIGALLAVGIVLKLTDPAFWAHHLGALIAIASLFFGGPLLKLLGRAGLRAAEALVGKLAEGATKLIPVIGPIVGRLIRWLWTTFIDGGTKLKTILIGAGITAVRGLWNGMQSLWGTFKTWLQTSALNLVLDIVEPFSHLPGKLGGWARKAKDDVNAQLDKITTKVTITFVSNAARVKSDIEDLTGSLPGRTGDGTGRKGDGNISVNLGNVFSGFGGGGSGSPSISSHLYDDIALGSKYGLSVSSGYRPGAITSTGNPSLHGMYPSHAVDLAGSAGAMSAFFRAELARGAPGLRELIHSPYWWHPGSGVTRISSPSVMAGHYDHVHVGTYDKGGWLKPGLTLAMNNTGRPERIVGPGAGGGDTYNIYNHGLIGSQRELDSWLVKSIERSKRRGAV